MLPPELPRRRREGHPASVHVLITTLSPKIPTACRGDVRLRRKSLAAPYLVFALHAGLPLAVAAVVLASVGYAASLLLQERLLALTPDEMSGHVLGLHSSGMLAMQGVGAALASAVAQDTSPATAMAVMAVVSIAVTLALAPGLRPDRRPPQPHDDLRSEATPEPAR